MNVTVYTTPTCATCKIAAKRLVAEGVSVDVVDLSAEPAVLAKLKDRLGLEQHQMVQVPLFENGDGRVLNITDLPDLLNKARSV